METDKANGGAPALLQISEICGMKTRKGLLDLKNVAGSWKPSTFNITSEEISELTDD